MNTHTQDSGEFKWTDELVREFFNDKGKYLSNPDIIGIAIQNFKQSHSVKEEKKEWQIVSFKGGKNDIIMQVKDIPDEYSINQYLSATSTWRIHSVRRLLDNEVFSIGDKDENFGKIVSFRIQAYKWILAECSNGIEINNVFLADLKKEKKEPLFYDELRNPIYKGDRYWRVNPDTFEVDTLNNLFYSTVPYKLYTTEQAAKDYVLRRKPILSLQDLLDNWADEGQGTWGEYYAASPMFKRFEQIAKQKIEGK